MAETQDKIKARLLQQVARMWGYSENEAETAFDPLVSMLLTACASELALLSTEIDHSHDRVTEKLIELLSPDTLSGVIPAHAIATGQPLEPNFTLSPNYQFFTQKKTRSSEKKTDALVKDLFFAATQPVHILDGQVQYVAFGEHLWTMDEAQYAEPFRLTNRSLPRTRLYIGLSLNERVRELNPLLFYFNTTAQEGKDAFFYHLKNARWYLGDQPITTSPGFPPEAAPVSAGFDVGVDRYANALKHVNHYYKKHFVTVNAGADMLRAYHAQQDLPEAIEAALPPATRNTRLLWFTLEFVSPLTDEVTSHLQCAINTFPVMNKRWQTSTFRLRKHLNVVPLITDDLFLDIEQVQNSSGLQYYRKETAGSFQPGELLIRTEGMGRFDSREASQFLDQLLDLLRDESVSFATYGREALSQDARSMSQLLSRLEQRIRAVEMPPDTTYLLLSDQDGLHQLFIEFYTTNGSLANGFPVGTPLRPFVGSEMRQGIRLLTPSTGGRDKLNHEGRINAYRSSLLSRNKLVTSEDIRARCLLHFAEYVTEVSIRKGYTESLSLREGLVRTIDIHLHTSVDETDEFWQYRCRDLLTLLQEKSVSMFPFRFFVNEKIIITD